MQQLVETLRHEQMGLAKNFGRTEPTPAPTNMGRAAAMHAFSAVRTGSIGLSGATGTVLMHTLLELHDLAKNVATIRIPGSSGVSATELPQAV